MASTAVNRKIQREFRLVYTPFCLVAVASFLTLEMKDPARSSAIALVLSLAYGISISVMFILGGVKIARQKDEFQRKLYLEALVWSTVTTLVISTIWGSLETFTNVHHMPTIFNFGIFMLVFAIAKVTLFRLNAPGEE
jgi:hypothetical protein